MSDIPKNTFNLQTALDLACAADRVNSGYVKTIEAVYADDQLMAYRIPNRELMLFTLGEIKYDTTANPLLKPTPLCVNMDDRELALEIKKFFRRLMFSAIEGEDQFRTELNAVLNADEIAKNKFGFVACLPSMYRREYAKVKIEKVINQLEPGYLGLVGNQLMDLDCEILEVSRSKNYDAWNIHAIINNFMVSWMSRKELKLGPCVVIKANVKDHSSHWKHNNAVTRLNYVKAFQ
jgi:hypothetical protein